MRAQQEPVAVLVLRFSAMGDVLLTTPALEALRRAWPRSRILFATKARWGPLLQTHPAIDELLLLQPGQGLLHFGRCVRTRLQAAQAVAQAPAQPALGPPAILDLHGTLRARLLRLLLPWGLRCVRWNKRGLFQTLAVRLLRRPAWARLRQADRSHAALEALVGAPLPRGRMQLLPDPAAAACVDQLLAARGVDPSRPLVCLSPGAAWETKRWPAERFAELARLALAAGRQVVVVGAPDERTLVEQVAAAAPGSLPLSRELDLAGLCALLSRCAAAVCNDSGPMHLARALGVPTLALFGSTDPGLFSFEGHRAQFLGLPCSPCSFYGRRRCPRGDLACLTGIGAQEACRELSLLLGGPHPPFPEA